MPTKDEQQTYSESGFSANRLATNPLIHPGLCNSIGSNINGPSLIRVPEWLENRLGQYYLYFAHHDGHYVRLAYSDSIEGPWQIYKPGVLPLASSLFFGHIASPDVHVDEANKELRLYYHGSDTATEDNGPQFSRVATSKDGINFTAHNEILGEAYLRVFRYRDWYYALAMPGIFYRSMDGLTNFEPGPRLFSDAMRHNAVLVSSDTLQVFFTNAGDCPESILHSIIHLSEDWLDWQASTAVRVLKPETHYEGANLAAKPSKRGIANEPVRELRDPAMFEEDGTRYILYSVAGEGGIAAAELQMQN